jgi:type I restriction enzyme M protein
MIDIRTLENWLWEAACAIRGPVDAPKFKDYILPLVFLKRLSDVFDDECAQLSAQMGEQLALRVLEQERDSPNRSVRFYIPEEARWEAIRQHGARGLGESLTDAMRAVARYNSSLHGVLDRVDYNATTAGQRILPDDYLHKLIEVLSSHRLGLHDVEPDMLGRAYEYLLRKFAEGGGQSAGEFYTPREVAILMARLLDPQSGMCAYDPTCGSGGLLIKLHLQFMEKYGVPAPEDPETPPAGVRRILPKQYVPLRLFGQEINPDTFALARMNAVIHDLDAEIRLGDTMRKPAFTDKDGQLMRFDLVVANPMWNQKFPESLYQNDPYDRFSFGAPPSSSADWGWLQHMLASLNAKGRMAVVLDTGAVSRGSGATGSNRERDLRKKFVEADLIEAVILLPENLFYNTTAPGVIIIINRAKRHKGEILLINASRAFEKGRPKNFLSESHIEAIARIYHEWCAVDANGDAPASAIITLADAARNDYNLSPSRYVQLNGEEETLPLEEALVRLQEAEEERAHADQQLQDALQTLGITYNGYVAP